MKKTYMAEENKARIGAGGALYLYDTPLAKYRLAMILSKIGVPKSSVGDVEVKVSSSATIGLSTLFWTIF